MTTAATGALAGLQVLDLTRYIPGPYATWLLAALGAEVTKVEEPPNGDATRAVPPAVAGESAAHAALNRSKRSMLVDIRQAAGAELVRELAARADVFVEAYRPGTLERRGLGAARLCAENPRLVYCSITGYGPAGPLSQRAGHDIDYVARAGLLAGTRDGQGQPVIPGAPLADMSAGLTATVGILAALQARERTGRGQVLSVSLMDSALALSSVPLTRQLAGGPARDELTGTHACYNLYRCRDGRFVSVGALEPKFWEGLCRALELPELLGRQWDSGARREQARERVARAFESRDRDDWLRHLADHDVCVEPVLDAETAWGQEQAARMAVRMPVGEGSARTLGVPFDLSETPADAGGKAPGLGEHTDKVLRQAGLSDTRIRELRAAAVIA